MIMKKWEISDDEDWHEKYWILNKYAYEKAGINLNVTLYTLGINNHIGSIRIKGSTKDMNGVYDVLATIDLPATIQIDELKKSVLFQNEHKNYLIK